jgi:hypothetical protein
MISAASVIALLAGTPFAGRYCSPYTVIPHTEFPVRGSTPPCIGKVNDEVTEIADYISKHGGDKGQSAAGNIVDGANVLQHVFGANWKSQTNANCVPVCVA